MFREHTTALFFKTFIVESTDAAYCAEKGLLDKMFYNSLTVWEEDLETEVKAIADIGVKHVLLVSFDQEDQMPSGRNRYAGRRSGQSHAVGNR